MDYGKWIRIGGKSWNVRILGMTQKSSILDSSNAGRNIADGAMRLDRIGTFYTYTLTIARDRGTLDEFDDLYDYLTAPRNTGISVVFPYGQKTIAFNAYVANGERELERIDEETGKIFWKSAAFNFISTKANKTP